jgi:hypothetical protein
VAAAVVLGFMALVMLLLVFNYGQIWFQAYWSKARVTFMELLGMILRKVNAGVNARLVAGGGTVLYRNSVRALLTFAHSTMSYGCMLIAMSFNAYVFFSLMLGFAIGTLLTGHWTEKASQPPVPREIISMGTLPDIRVSGLDGDTPRDKREVDAGIFQVHRRNQCHKRQHPSKLHKCPADAQTEPLTLGLRVRELLH